MFDLITYIIITIILVAFSMLRNFYTKDLSKISPIEIPAKNKTPYLFLFILSFILSLYSTYLAMSEKLVDPVRYAWSFYNRYPIYYDSIVNMFNSETEISFLILNKIIYSITNDVVWLFLIIAFVVNFLTLFTAIKISKKITFFLILYMFSQYYFFTTYALRQALGVAIANIAVLYYLKGKNLKYIIFSLLAMSFHLTAFILIPLLFIYKILKSKLSYILIMFIFLISVIFFDFIFYNILPILPLVGEMINVSPQNNILENQSFMVVLKGLPFYLVTFIAILKRQSLLNLTKYADVFIVSALFFSLSWLLSFNFYWLFRMSWYFGVLTLSLIPLIYKVLYSKYEKALFLIIVIFPLCAITLRQIFITLN